MMLKLQYFGHLMQRGNSLENILMLGKIEERGRGPQRMRCLDGVIDSMDMSLLRHWEGRTGKPWVLQSMVLQRIWHMTERVNNSNNLSTQTFSLFAMPGFSQIPLCSWLHSLTHSLTHSYCNQLIAGNHPQQEVLFLSTLIKLYCLNQAHPRLYLSLNQAYFSNRLIT